MTQNVACTGPQKRFCEALLTKRVAEAADMVGISVRQAQRWLHRPAVRAYLREIEAQLIEQACRLGAQYMTTVMAGVLKLAQDPLVMPSSRIAAARTVFDATLRIRELLVGEERLCEIEKKLEELAWMAVGGKDEGNKSAGEN